MVNDIYYNCNYCNTKFRIPDGLKNKKRKHRFCSWLCWDKFRKKPNAICDNCKKEYHTSIGYLKRSTHHFCSSKCVYEYQKYNSNFNNFNENCHGKLEKHPNWLGGKSFQPYGLKFNNKLKIKIRQRDNYICQECGFSEEDLGYNLSIHHIDYNKQNNNENNLISLCKSCHSKTNYNRIDWNLHYSNIIRNI